MFNLGRCNDVDVVLLDGFGEILRHGVFDRLCTRRPLAVGAKMGVNHATRCLARAKARNSHLACQFAIGDVDVVFEGGLVDRHFYLYFVAFKLLDRALHEC